MVDMYIPDTIDIDSGVFLSCKTSRNTYEAAFEEKNKKIVDKEVQLKLVDSGIPDLKSKIDALQKTCQTLDALLPAEKDIHNSQTISKRVVVKRKDREKKEDIKKSEKNLRIMGEHEDDA